MKLKPTHFIVFSSLSAFVAAFTLSSCGPAASQKIHPPGSGLADHSTVNTKATANAKLSASEGVYVYVYASAPTGSEKPLEMGTVQLSAESASVAELSYRFAPQLKTTKAAEKNAYHVNSDGGCQMVSDLNSLSSNNLSRSTEALCIVKHLSDETCKIALDQSHEILDISNDLTVLCYKSKPKEVRLSLAKSLISKLVEYRKLLAYPDPDEVPGVAPVQKKQPTPKKKAKTTQNKPQAPKPETIEISFEEAAQIFSESEKAKQPQAKPQPAPVDEFLDIDQPIGNPGAQPVSDEAAGPVETISFGETEEAPVN